MLISKKKYNTKKEKCAMLLFFILLPIFSIGQTIKKSLINEKKSADSLFLMSKTNLKKRDFKKALFTIHKSLTIYTNLKENKNIGDCYKQIATIQFYQGEFTKALANFENSKQSFKKANFKKGVASAINNKGNIYYYLGNLPKALEHYKKALKLHETLKNEKEIASTTQNIGNIYLRLNNLENAEKYFEIAKETYIKKSDNKALPLILSSLGSVNMKEKKYNKALKNYNEALNLAIKVNKKQIQAEVLINLGKLSEEKENFTKAIVYYKQSLKLSKEIKNNIHLSNALIALGEVNLKLHKKNTAIKKCKEGLEIAKKIKVISIQEEGCKCLYDSYKATNKVKKALFYYEQMHVLKDSMNLKKTANNLLNMQFEKEMLLDSITHIEKERKAQIKYNLVIAKKEKQRNIVIIMGLFVLIIAGSIFSRLKFVKKSKARLQIEKDRSESLLLNILPEEIAEELKEKGFVDAQDFETASILFTDFKSFTETASKLNPQELVAEINTYFKAFDAIIETYQIEKIKTIGDAYMAAGGLPEPDVNAVKNTILAAIDMQAFVIQRKLTNDKHNKSAFEMRVGIHIGPIVAGIVGVKKFQYDIWGDTVNTASRMESNGKVGKVNISQDTYLLVKDEKDLTFEYRGKVQAKGKGELAMYFVDKK